MTDDTRIEDVEALDADEASSVDGEPNTNFWAHISRRIIVTSNMERDVRLAFISSLAIIAVVMLVHIFGKNLGPKVHTLTGEVPVGSLAALVVGELLVFTLTMLGLLRLGSKQRWISLGVTAVVLAGFIIFNEAWTQAWPLLVPLGAAALLGDIIALRRWGQPVAFAIAFALAASIVGLLVTGARGAGQPFLVSLLGLQATLSAIGLLMSSTDLAEMATLISEASVGSLQHRLKLDRLMTPVAVALALGSIVVSLHNGPTTVNGIVQQISAGAGSALHVAIMFWLLRGTGKRLGAVEPELQYRILFLIVCAYWLAIQAGLFEALLHDPKGYSSRTLLNDSRASDIPILLALAAVVGFLIFGRRSPRRFAWLGFANVVGLFLFLVYASQGAALVGLQDGVAIFSLIYLAVASSTKSGKPRFKAIRRLVAQVNFSYIVYGLLVLLFASTKGEAGSFSLWQVAVILGALAWDIVTSGEAITNQHTDVFPRISRVCLFLGYTASVAMLVLVAGSSEFVNPLSGGSPLANPFEPEPIVAMGLMLFGSPFVFFIFAMRVRAVVLKPQAEASSGPRPWTIGVGVRAALERIAASAKRTLCSSANGTPSLPDSGHAAASDTHTATASSSEPLGPALKDVIFTSEAVVLRGQTYPLRDIADVSLSSRDTGWQPFAAALSLALAIWFYAHHETNAYRAAFFAMMIFSYWASRNPAWIIFDLPARRVKVLQSSDLDYLKAVKGQVELARANIL